MRTAGPRDRVDGLAIARSQGPARLGSMDATGRGPCPPSPCCRGRGLTVPASPSVLMAGARRRVADVTLAALAAHGPGLVTLKGEARYAKAVESGRGVSLVSGAAASLRSRRAGDGERPPPSPGVASGPAGSRNWRMARSAPGPGSEALRRGESAAASRTGAGRLSTACTPRLAGWRAGEGACHDRGYASRHQGFPAAPQRSHHGRGRGGAGRS